jgi:alpha-tubulin suppressor-like RCC1 family protein
MPNIKRGMMGAAGAGGLTGYDFWVWGNAANGALGTGNQGPYLSSPLQLGSGNSSLFTSVNLAGTWGAGIRSDYTLYMWGFNGYGPLGQGNTISQSSPVQVGALKDWKAISGTQSGAALAIKTDGTLWAWGSNVVGETGDGTKISKSSPIQIGSLTDWSTPVRASSQSAGAIKTDGTLWVWGDNTAGCLGLGDSPAGKPAGATWRSSPVQVGSLTTWTAGVHINEASAGIIGGKLYTWGHNYDGSLGLGDTTSRSSPVQVGSLTNWSKVSIGGHAMLAVKTDGTLWAWGKNPNGQLGDGTVINKSSPIQVGSLTNWSEPVMGSTNAGDSGALKTDGTIWMWGTNTYGQLGQDNTITTSSPVQVGTDTTWKHLDSAHSRTFALKEA